MAEVPPGDGEQLPWLEPARPGPAVIRRGDWGLNWFVALLILLLVGAGAFVLGTRSDFSKRTITPLPQARPVETLPQPDPAEPLPEEAPVTAPALARADREAATVDAAPHPMPEQIRAAQDIAERVRANRKIVAPPPPPPPPPPAYTPSVGPPGTVIQLGSYATTAEAEAAAQLFRYRYRGLLAAIPKAVLPYRPRGTKKLFYRVQFIAPSQVYADVACERIRDAGKSCLVI